MVNEKVFLGFFNMLAEEDKEDVLAFLFKRVNNTVLKKQKVSLQLETAEEAKPAPAKAKTTRVGVRNPITVFGVDYPSEASAFRNHGFTSTQVTYRANRDDNNNLTKAEALEELVRERDAATPVPEAPASPAFIGKDYKEVKPVSLTIGGNNV
jgi:hypothetical protein